MPFKDISVLLIRLYNAEGKVIDDQLLATSPLKYGEAMANAAAHARSNSTQAAFQLLNKDRQAGFVNHLDGLAAARFMLTSGATGIFKHTGICGAAYGFGEGNEAAEYAASSSVDEVARFGGIISARRITPDSAREMVGKSGQKKQDVIISLDFVDDAADILLAANTPPLVYKLLDTNFDIAQVDIQHGLDGYVIQERIQPLSRGDIKVAVQGTHTMNDKVLDDIIFGFKVADTRFSNSICYVSPTETGAIAVGISGGASDRVTASQQAMEKAVKYILHKYLAVPREQMPEEIHETLYMVSDGFFPDVGALYFVTREGIIDVKSRISGHPYPTEREEFFKNRDVLELLKSEGWDMTGKMRFISGRLHIDVPVVLNPGGSKKDEDVLRYADDRKMTMLVTERDGKHLRCFKHGAQSAYAVR